MYLSFVTMKLSLVCVLETAKIKKSHFFNLDILSKLKTFFFANFGIYLKDRLPERNVLQHSRNLEVEKWQPFLIKFLSKVKSFCKKYRPSKIYFKLSGKY